MIGLQAAFPSLWRGSSTLKSSLSFGPFLAVGALVTVALFTYRNPGRGDAAVGDRDGAAVDGPRRSVRSW